MVTFLKSMTVSNGMLTFARSGVPKTLPNIDKTGVKKRHLSLARFFIKHPPNSSKPAGLALINQIAFSQVTADDTSHRQIGTDTKVRA